MNNNNLKEGGDPERLDITFGGTALHAAVASNEDDQARGITFVEGSTNQQITNHDLFA